MSAHTLKAFVCSTFTDLRAHRGRAIDALRRGGLHIDPMEDWGSASTEPSHFCRERLDGCDLCLLLVAFRRGTVPPGETLSITQLEYQHAIARGIDVLPYLLADDETNWPASFDERAADPLLGQWRDRLRQRHGCGAFRADPASVDVGADVLRWLQARRPDAARISLSSPFDFTSYLASKRHQFVGREWLFEEIEAWRTRRQERSLLIVGDPGIGKSAIAAVLAQRQADRVLAVHCCRADNPASLQPALVVRSLASQAARQLPAYAALLGEPAVAEALSEGGCAGNPVQAYEQGILSPLARLPAPAEGVHYLLIDALDEAISGDVRGLTLVDLLAARLEQMPAWLRLVVTTRREAGVLQKMRGLRARELSAQDPRNLDDVRSYLRQRLAEPPLCDLRWDSGRAAGLLLKRSAGNFLYVRQALEMLTEEADPLASLESLPPGLSGFYLRSFERHYPDEAAYEKTCRLLRVVLAAREPLTERQLAAATGLEFGRELPAVMRGLGAFLVRRKGPDGEGVLAVYHKSLADWLTADETRRDTIYFAGPEEGHARLADSCWAEYRRGPRGLSGYARRHLPGHLTATARWDDLAELLTDLFYLEQRAEAGEVFGLAADFRAAVRALPREHEWRRRLDLLEEALRLDIHFLQRHPTALFQTLWNRCWWYDCPDAARYYEPSSEPGPWEVPGPKLCSLLESWRRQKERATHGFYWLRSLRPPEVHLGTAVRMILRGHTESVSSVTVSDDGRLLASGSDDFTVRIWDVESGAELRCLRGHEGVVTAVAFAAAGRCLASGSADCTVRVWDLESGTAIRCLVGHKSTVNGVAFSPGGCWIASGSSECTVRVWDAETGEELHCLRGHEGVVTAVTFATDGRLASASGGDDSIRIWDAKSGAELCCLSGHKGVVTGVAFAVDGRLASGSRDCTIRIWDPETTAELLSLSGHTDSVNAVAFAPDGRRLASASRDYTVRIWDAETGAEIRPLKGHDRMVTDVVFAPDGRWVASASWDHTVRIWDVSAGTALRHLRGHDKAVNEVTFAPDGCHFASASYDCTVRIWESEAGTEVRCLQGHEYFPNGLAFAPDGRRLASASVEGSVRIWNPKTGECLEVIEDALRIPRGFGWPLEAGRWQATSVELGTAVVDSDSGQRIAWFPVRFEKLAPSPTGRAWAGCNRHHVHLLTLEGTGVADRRPG